jgi:hypothetical protein
MTKQYFLPLDQKVPYCYGNTDLIEAHSWTLSKLVNSFLQYIYLQSILILSFHLCLELNIAV